VTILDANILLYAYNLDSPHHGAASRWLEELFHSSELVGLSWPAIWAFLRIGTNTRAGGRAELATAHFEIAAGWLRFSGVILVQPGSRHLELLKKMVIEGNASGSMMSDAVLAALAIENGAILASTDRHFDRFPGLKWINPLDS